MAISYFRIKSLSLCTMSRHNSYSIWKFKKEQVDAWIGDWQVGRFKLKKQFKKLFATLD